MMSERKRRYDIIQKVIPVGHASGTRDDNNRTRGEAMMDILLITIIYKYADLKSSKYNTSKSLEGKVRIHCIKGYGLQHKKL